MNDTVEIPAKNFPPGVGPESFSPSMLRKAAEYRNGLYPMLYPVVELKPWVVLTLLDAWDELASLKAVSQHEDGEYHP